jgi:hypothetical protein
LHARIFHAEIGLGILGGQLDEESRAVCIPVPDQGQVEVSIAEFDEGLWPVARDARKLAEEDLLDSKPADLEGHLRRGQKHAGKLGEVLDVHRRTLPLGIVEFLLLGHDLDYLGSRQWKNLTLGGPEGLLRAAHILALSFDYLINLLACLERVDLLILFPKCLQRACMSDARSPPSPLPSSLVADPAQEAV